MSHLPALLCPPLLCAAGQVCEALELLLRDESGWPVGNTVGGGEADDGVLVGELRGEGSRCWDPIRWREATRSHPRTLSSPATDQGPSQ